MIRIWFVLLFALLPKLVLGQTNVKTDIGLWNIDIYATTQVHADGIVVWNTLTDYNRLASFVPDMTLSRVKSPPDAPVKLVEQRGSGGLLSMILPDYVLLEIRERPYHQIAFRSVSGLGLAMEGEWVIQGTRAPVILGYRTQVTPSLPSPPVLTDSYVESEIRTRMEAVAREAERRMRLR